jgi:hypothetical protein
MQPHVLEHVEGCDGREKLSTTIPTPDQGIVDIVRSQVLAPGRSTGSISTSIFPVASRAYHGPDNCIKHDESVDVLRNADLAEVMAVCSPVRVSERYWRFAATVGNGWQKASMLEWKITSKTVRQVVKFGRREILAVPTWAGEQSVELFLPKIVICLHNYPQHSIAVKFYDAVT